MPKATTHTAVTPTTVRIFTSIRQALEQSVNKNNEASFNMLVDSITENISIAQQTNNVDAFQLFLRLLMEPYAAAHQRASANSDNRIGYFFLEGLTLSARWNLYYLLEAHQLNPAEGKNRAIMARSVFSLFSDYLEANIRFADHRALLQTFNKITEVIQDLIRRTPDIRKLLNSTEDERYSLHNGWEDPGHMAIHFWMLQAAANYWTIFLYDEKKITLEQLQRFQEILALPNFSFDIYFPLTMRFREGMHPGPVRSWHDWDHEERLSGKVYSPPQPIRWAVWGFVVQLIKFDAGIHARSFEHFDAGAVEYGLDDLLQRLETLKKEGFERYHRYFEVADENAYEKRIEPYIQQVKQLRKRSDDERLHRIAQLPVSSRITGLFTDLFVQGYRKASDILRHFTELGVVEKVAVRDKLQTIGAVHQFWNSSKHHFIDSEEFNIPVFGMEQFGRELADNFETVFLTRLQDSHSLHLAQDRLSGLREELGQLRKEGYAPSVILMGYDTWSSLLAYEPPPGYEAQKTTGQNDVHEVTGRFDGIPVLRSRSPMLSGTIMVADARASFIIRLFDNPDSAYHDVTASIQEISEEEANTMFDKNPAYWLAQTDEKTDAEKAKIIIRNGVSFNLYVMAEFIIRDPKAFRFIAQGNPQ